MTESQFQSRLLKALRAHPALKEAIILKLNADATTKGIPDVMVTILGRTTFFELKVEPNEPSKIQVYYLRKLTPRGYVVKKCKSGALSMKLVDGHVAWIVWNIEALADEIALRCVND